MDEIFARAKSILVIWADGVDPDNLPTFQDTIQTKAKQAHIAFENVQMLLDCKFKKKWKYFFIIFYLKKKARRATSSFDIILFGLVSKRDIPTTIDLLNELFRLLRPNGHLITHIEHVKQSQIVDHFKMCGFNSCNPLDANSSFLIQNKDDDVKKLGSLWLCQKPSFDIGYSVPLRNTGQVSSTNGGKKTWTVDDDDDLIDTDELLDENDRKKPDVKSKF